MALITDPDNLTQGTKTDVADAAWTASSGANTVITGSATLPVFSAGDLFEIRLHSVAANNGLYIATGTPTASNLPCTKVDGVDPSDQTAEDVDVMGTTDEKSVMIDTGTKRIYLLEQGSLSTDGVTGQTLYSFLKEEWKSDATLIPHQFPMVAVTPEQFEFVEDWNPQDVTSPAIQTRKLIRSAGWSEIDTNSVIQAQYMGIVTLGTFAEATDQAHYQLGNDPTDTAAAVDFTFAGPVNEAVKTMEYVGVDPGTGYTFVDGGGGDDSITRTATDWDTLGFKVGGDITLENCKTAANDGTFTITALSTTTLYVGTGLLTADTLDTTGTAWVDDRSAVTVFCREPFTTSLDPDSGKTYGSANLSDIGVTAVDNKAFRFPLATVADLKVTTADATIAGSSPYTQIVVKYFDGVYSRDVDTSTNRSFGICIDVGTHSGIDGSFSAAGSTLTSLDGGLPTDTTYDGGTLYILSGTDEGDTFTISDVPTATTVTISGTFTSTDSAVSFTMQRATPVVATAEEIYEKVQWSLRQNSDIDDTDGAVTGSTGAALLAFVGDTLITREAYNPNTGAADGVIIEGFDSNDTNRITFTDNAGATFTYPFVAAGSITFNAYLVNDTGPASYWMFFTYTHTVQNTGFGTSASSGSTCTLDSSTTDLTTILADQDYIALRGFTDSDIDGVYVVEDAAVTSSQADLRRVDGNDCVDESAGATVNVDLNPIDSPDAVIVDNNSGVDVQGTIGGASVAFDFDYDGNVQGGRTQATDAAVTIRAIGEELAQFVETTGTITRATGLTFGLVAGLERNFDNP